MRIVLIKDFKGLGRKNDVKNVSDGYARNFLMPRGIAKLATGEELEKLDTIKQNIEATDTKIKEILEELHRETEEKPINVPIKTGSRGEIFSSIKEADVRQALTSAEPRFSRFAFDIELEKHIKEMGVHEVGINVGRGIKNTLKIEIVPEINS